jgi:hypothetical protein
VLDNLDNIDWSRVNHAYGPATDLPATLRALASGDKEQRERALWELHGNIWHQGTVYEATALAVPFLLELVRGKHPKSLEILWLLALIADGKSYGAAHGNLVKAADQEYQNQLARELDWVARSKEAIAKGQALFLEFLAAKDSKLREISIFLLGLTCAVAQDDISAVEVIERILGAES